MILNGGAWTHLLQIVRSLCIFIYIMPSRYKINEPILFHLRQSNYYFFSKISYIFIVARVNLLLIWQIKLILTVPCIIIVFAQSVVFTSLHIFDLKLHFSFFLFEKIKGGDHIIWKDVLLGSTLHKNSIKDLPIGILLLFML